MTTYFALTTVVFALSGACGRTKKEMITDLYVEIIYKTERRKWKKGGGWGGAGLWGPICTTAGLGLHFFAISQPTP